jgi:polar amino acid transport system permease protein
VPFAAFIVAIFIYWMLCLLVEGGIMILEKRAEARR